MAWVMLAIGVFGEVVQAVAVLQVFPLPARRHNIKVRWLGAVDAQLKATYLQSMAHGLR
jgi:hypothetical protein